MSIKQLSVFMENRPGTLLTLTGILAAHDIDMRALSIVETEDFGIARIIVDDVYETATILKDEGYVSSITPVIGVYIPNVPGGMNRVLTLLADANVNIEYMYAFLSARTSDQATMIFRVADNAAASAALTASSTSPTKSKYPGVSSTLIFAFSHSIGTKAVLIENSRFSSSLSKSLIVLPSVILPIRLVAPDT